MFRFLTIVVAIGVAIYKTFYGETKGKNPPFSQTNNQPVDPSFIIPVRRNPPKAPPPKPEVLFGDPLTDEEWEMIQRADQPLLN